MLGIRPVTPGTVVVLAGTILLVLVSVSVPILKSIYFLEATVSATVQSTTVDSGNIRLGVWGYCVGSACSNATLGYSLNNIDQLLGISTTGVGALVSESIPTALVRGLSYVLVLHPVAAGFGAIAAVCGLLAHIREFAIVGFTTCFAGIGAFIALVAFIFDMVLFTLAKNRIIAAGGTASYGNAIWMTLAGMLLLMFSGCFFGLGRCLIRKRRPEREASEKNKPVIDPNYSNSMRQDAVGGGYGQGGMYGNNAGGGFNSTRNGHGESLPEFQEYNGEIIPLTSVRPDEDPDEDLRGGYHDRDERTEAASLISGVGMGYGRRTAQGQPISIAAESSYNERLAHAGQYSSAANLAAPPRRSQSGSPSTVAPFVGMSQPIPDEHHYLASASPPPQALYAGAGASAYRSPPHSPPPMHSPPLVASSSSNPYLSTSYPPEKGAGAYQGAYNTPYSPQRQASASAASPQPLYAPPVSPPPAQSSSSHYDSPSIVPSYTSHSPPLASNVVYNQPGLYAADHDVLRHSASSYGASHEYAPQDSIAYQPHQQQDPYTYGAQHGGGNLPNPYDRQ